MWFDGVVKALRTPEARDGLAHFAWFEGFLHTPPKACGQRAAERRGAYKLSGGGRKLLHELDGCAVETRAVRRRSLPETPFGVYVVELVVVAFRGVRLAESGGLTTCRSLHTPREAAGLLRGHSGCEDAGLVWQLYAPPATR